MNDPVTVVTIRMTMIFGMKASVTSWTWVSAWKKAIRIPTAIAAPTAGPDETMIVQIADWTIVRASASFMGSSADDDAGAEQHLAATLQRGERPVGSDLDG